MRSKLEKWFWRQKISPTTPMSGRLAVVVGRDGAEPVAGADHHRDEAFELLPVRDADARDGVAGLLEAGLVDGVCGALLALVGARLEQQLHEDVLGEHRPPGGPDELLRVGADRRVAVVRGDADDRHVVVAELVELRADEVQVLAEAAGPVRRGHEEGDVVAALVLDDAQEVAEDDLLRVALVARGDAPAEVQRAFVGVGRHPGVEADRADRRRQQVGAPVGHLRQVQPAALHPEVGDGLLDARVLDRVTGHRRPPPPGTRAPRRPRPVTTSAGTPCCPDTPRSASWRRRRSGARRTAGSGTACPTPRARSA